MELNKAPGRDGFPSEIYTYFWEIIKQDIMNLFAHLQ
jgi:hypothetical protein